EHHPPACGDTLGVGFEVHAARRQIEIRDVRAVAVQKYDLLKSVVGEALAHVDDHLDEGFPVDIDGAGKIHHVRGVAVHDGRHEEDLGGNDPGGGRCAA